MNTTVSIIGLGYVGLPLALLCVEKGCKVYGIDVDKEKIDTIKKGESPLHEEFIFERSHLLNKLNVSTSYPNVKKADIVIITVPTPVDEHFFPDLSIVEKATHSIEKHLKKGALVIVESTINPGVCEEVVMPILEANNKKEGKDFFLAHCPERINPGDTTWNVTNINRVVGARSKQGLKKVQAFYQSILDADVRPMKSIREAEAVKMVENSFRDINIAFVNELAQSFDRLGIDTVDVINGAATKPFAFLPHYPSRGVGGHCIPVDPYYLIEKAKTVGFDHRFLRAAREINNKMPHYTVNLLQELLNECKKPMNGTTVAVLGISYKANVDDVRESPALEIMRLLKEKGSNVIAFDPFILHRSDVKTLETALQKAEAVIVNTNHSEFLTLTKDDFKKHGIIAIVDGMNALDGGPLKRAGIKYHGIGRR